MNARAGISEALVVLHEEIDGLTAAPDCPSLVSFLDEARVAAFVLLFPERAHELRCLVDPGDLVHTVPRTILAAVWDLTTAGEPVNIERILAWVRKVDGRAVVTRDDIVALVDRVHAREGWGAFCLPDDVHLAARTVRDLAARRELVAIGREAINRMGPRWCMPVQSIVAWLVRALNGWCARWGMGEVSYQGGA